MAIRALPALLLGLSGIVFGAGCGGMGPQSLSALEPGLPPAEEDDDELTRLLSFPPGHYAPMAPVPEVEPSFGTCVGQPSTAKPRPGPRTISCCYTNPSVFVEPIRKKLPAAKTCYEEALKRDPSTQGRVVSKFVIEFDGSVTGACDAGSTVGDPELVECVLRVMTTVTFMATPDDDPCGPVTINYPIQFSPKE